MRVAWVVSIADVKVASFRYRCLIPAWALQQGGHDSAIFVDERPEPAAFDALIVVKRAGQDIDDLARSFRAQGKPVFLDLCDNIFVPGYAQRRGPDLAPETAISLMREANGFVTPTSALDRVARGHLGPEPGSWVVPDAAIGPGDYQAISAWLPAATIASRRGGVERLFSGPRWGFGAESEAQGGPGQGGGAKDKHDGDLFNVESDWAVDHLPDETARVIWFGRHGSFHSEFGMGLLKPVIEQLEQVHRDRPVELVIISNNRIRFDALTHGVRIFTRYESWSNERVFFELSRADLFVMPSAADPFSLCKSANRAVLALANGVPVTASYLESLEPLREVLVLDDWRAGLEGYLLDPAMSARHLAAAQPILADQFSVDAIARLWAAALHDPTQDSTQALHHARRQAQMA